ncbi:nucleoside-diphosphate sugar epimerase/dehydratase [Noviherbaspirillum malthae]|uniref:nucleoside-diphosphate sugar epimerase/dehydratase n=1 Tax=Noviherbaspirillum malthae TaxID=1260987 RepID=UPI00188FC043|nr:hypothetical protein [Noviherbaspirillum malthae]
MRTDTMHQLNWTALPRAMRWSGRRFVAANRVDARMAVGRRVADLVILILAAQLASYHTFAAGLAEIAPLYLVIVGVCCTFSVFIFTECTDRCCTNWFAIALSLARLTLQNLLLLSLGLVFSALNPLLGTLSTSWLGYWLTYTIGFLAMARIVNYWYVCSFTSRRVMVIGYGPIAEELYSRLRRRNGPRYDVSVIYAAGHPLPSHWMPTRECITTLDNVNCKVSAYGIDEVLIAIPGTDVVELDRIRHALRHTLVTVRWIPDWPMLFPTADRERAGATVLLGSVVAAEANTTVADFRDEKESIFHHG